MSSTLLRLSQVKEKTGLGTTSIYTRVKDGLLPPPIKITERCSAWPEHEIDAINHALIAGRDMAEIRTIVRDLVADRQKSTA